MKSIITLIVISSTMSVALGAICNGKGLCMSIENSFEDHFHITCSFNSNGRTLPANTIEWKISAPGLDPTGPYSADYYANLSDDGKLYFDWGAARESDERTAARVVCISKGQGFGWNQVEGKIYRGGRELF